MFIVDIGGGLGNQLFQYAFSIWLHKRYPTEDIVFDISSYDLINEHNGFELNKYFEFNEKIVDNNVLKKVKPERYFICKYFKRLSFRKKFFIKKVITLFEKISYTTKNIQVIKDTPTSDYNRGLLEIKDSKNKIFYFQGNWQNIMYYEEIQDLLLSKIKFKENLKLEAREIANRISSDSNSVCIHIRRGDYVNTRFDLCNHQYYKKAVDKMYLLVGHSNIKFYVFSDDLEFAENLTKFIKNKEMVKTGSSGTDMFLMSICHNYILANSTFSFWGCFLNKKPNNVIFPKYMYIFKDMYYRFSVPKGWVEINNVSNI